MPDFISLDISVQSTGWVSWYNKELTYGCYGMKSTVSYDRRKEFSEFLINLIGDKDYKMYFVEDVIRSENFKTERILIELNGVIENLIMYGITAEKPVYRKLASVWENEIKNLYDGVLKIATPKETTQMILNSLGFELTPERVKEVGGTKADSHYDIYDALGLAISMGAFGVNTDKKGNVANVTKPQVLHTDLSKGYKFKQFASESVMIDAAKKKCNRSRKGKKMYCITYDTAYKNLLLQFKEFISDKGEDDAIYCITTPLNKIGAMPITKGFDISQDVVYFIAER